MTLIPHTAVFLKIFPKWLKTVLFFSTEMKDSPFGRIRTALSEKASFSAPHFEASQGSVVAPSSTWFVGLEQASRLAGIPANELKHMAASGIIGSIPVRKEYRFEVSKLKADLLQLYAENKRRPSASNDVRPDFEPRSGSITA